MKRFIFIAFICLLYANTVFGKHYVGGDISLLPAYEAAGSKYLDGSGNNIKDVVTWCAAEGMNAMRVRVFVNPAAYKELHASDKDTETRYDPNACQTIEDVVPLCRRIVESGMALMIDFHYSDTWADPAKQWTPTDWEGLDDAALAQQVYDYTRQSLITLRDNGIVPSFIQTGNEISYGMLWGPLGTAKPLKTYTSSNANWERLGNLLRHAGAACREICPDAKIVLHTERVAQPDVLVGFYERMQKLEIDYDIIGLSYYPYFHGDMNVLSTALSRVTSQFPTKDAMIVETGYAYKWAVPGSIYDYSKLWPYTAQGQAQFAADLVGTLEKYEAVTGLFWWWMEYNAYGSNLSGWYNAPLWDSTTGRVTPAFKTLCGFAADNSVAGVVDDTESDERCYDLLGRGTAPDTRGIIIKNRKKILNP